MKDNLRDARERLKQAKKEKASKKNISDIENELKNIQQAQKDNKAAKKEAEKALAELHKRIDLEAKPVLKKKFDYDVPIAMVEDAGITTTGAASEGNQLPSLLEEYTKYRRKNNLWNSVDYIISYRLNEDNQYYRIAADKEVVLNG